MGVNTFINMYMAWDLLYRMTSRSLNVHWWFKGFYLDDFELQYTPGKSLDVAVTLSRASLVNNSEYHDEETIHCVSTVINSNQTVKKSAVRFKLR